MKEDIFILIESHRLELTYVEEIIANYFISKKAPLNIDKLAQTLAVSKASITRFCKKIGLDNYKELMFLYNLSLDKKEEPSISSAVTAIYHALATRSDNAYSEVEVDKLCALIKDHNIIHFFGKGFNSYTGADFSFKFSRFGKYVRVISEEKSILMSAEFAREGEMILVASLRGIDSNFLEAMTITKEKNIPIALITSNPNSDLIKQADITLISAGLTHEESIGNISPQIPILIQLDILYERYLHLFSDSVKKWIKSEEILHKNKK